MAEAKTSIFLIGSSPKDNANSIREMLSQAFTGPQFRGNYRIVYPEDLFREVTVAHDLLTMERVLARGVHAIVVCAESAGALVELGAFSMDDELHSRVILVNLEKYKGRSSFINRGPGRHLQAAGNPVLWWGDKTNPMEKAKEIARQIQEVRRRELTLTTDVANPLTVHNFVLPFTYLMGPIAEATIQDCIMRLSKDLDSDAVEISLKTALTMLRRQALVSSRGGLFDLTDGGTREMKSIIQRLHLSKDFDSHRVETMNYRFAYGESGRLRGNELKVS